MRRNRFILLALLTMTVTAGVQAQVVAPVPPAMFVQAHPDGVARVTAADVVARMLSFDRNDDGKVEKAELAERMQPTVARGDVDGDGALDMAELRALASAPAQDGFPKFFGSGSYGFADETSLSSRSRIDGALDDLVLAGPVRERAAAIVTAYVDTLEVAAMTDLMTEMSNLLTTDQLADFKAAVDAQLRGRSVTTVSRDGAPRQQIVFRGGLDAGRRIEGYALLPDRTTQANAAFTAYKSRLRLGDTERSELLARMDGVLSVQERDDFRAALERRPVVATGGGVLSGFAGDVIIIAPPGRIDVVRPGVRSGVVPAILRTPATR